METIILLVAMLLFIIIFASKALGIFKEINSDKEL